MIDWYWRPASAARRDRAALLGHGAPGTNDIVIGENHTFQGPEDYMRSRGVELTILQDAECIQLMRDFITKKPELWNEDIGV